MDEFTLEQDDGTKVFCRRWLPSGTPRALVVVVHGASEHSGRYDGVAGVLRDGGHAVYDSKKRAEIIGLVWNVTPQNMDDFKRWGF